MEKFFQEKKNSDVLNGYLLRAGSLTVSSKFIGERNIFMENVLKDMLASPEAWDSRCQMNIRWFGESFISKLGYVAKESSSEEELDFVCAAILRFVIEYDLSSAEKIDEVINSGRGFLLRNVSQFSDSARAQVKYAVYEMPISILKGVVNSGVLSDVDMLRGFLEAAKQEKSLMEEAINEKKKEVDEIKKSLEKYKEGFNFVGLYDGFNRLSEEKRKESKWLLIGLYMLGFIVVLPVLLNYIYIYFNADNVENIKNNFWFLAFPTVSLVAVSIYYFRVVLFNYKSVKSQLLQIELRKTLCRFVQDYARYAQEIRAQDKDMLVKFENVIFSGIVTDDNQLPSTFDGIDQLSKLIKSIK